MWELEKKALIFIVIAVVVIGAVYLAFPAVFNFSAFHKPAKPPIVAFFLKLDTASSTIAWQTVSESTSTKNYAGTINFRFGEIGRDAAGNLTGSFTANTPSLKVTGDSVATAVLKSADWFEASRFGLAEFDVTDLQDQGPIAISATTTGENYQLSGTLTIRGVTNPLKVPLLVTVVGKRILALGQFTFSRQDFQLGLVNPKLPSQVKVSVRLVSQLPATPTTTPQ